MPRLGIAASQHALLAEVPAERPRQVCQRLIRKMLKTRECVPQGEVVAGALALAVARYQDPKRPPRAKFETLTSLGTALGEFQMPKPRHPALSSKEGGHRLDPPGSLAKAMGRFEAFYFLSVCLAMRGRRWQRR